MTHNFCIKLKDLLQNPELSTKRLVYYSIDPGDLSRSTNAVYLLGAFLVLHLKFTPSEAWGPFSKLTPSPCRPYRDATWRPSQYPIHVKECWAGLVRAVLSGLYVRSTFDADEYFYYDDPSNGDIHEVVKGKLLALQGPASPSNYAEVFKAKGVTTVVSLSRREYDDAEVAGLGFEHHDLVCDDCATPPDDVVDRFVRLADAAPGTVAVHCMSGLGSTGTLIAAYLMHRRAFAANEAIAWVRICRPGSVIGPQQQYLKQLEGRLARPGSSRPPSRLSTARGFANG